MNLYGYRLNMRQASTPVALTVSLPDKLDLVRVDAWLKEYFEVEPPTLLDVLRCRLVPGVELTLVPELLARVLAIYNVLCRVSWIPCYETGRVVGVEQRGQRWRLALLVPAVNGLERQIFEELTRQSFMLAIHFMNSPLSDETAHLLYEKMDKQVLPLFRSVMPDGRANTFVAGLAHKLGVPWEHLGFGTMQLGLGHKMQMTQRSACLGDSAIGARHCANKVRTALMLLQAGLPAPKHDVVANLKQAQTAADRLGWPVVVKPADRERGEGVTVDVSDAVALSVAFEKARALSANILVEQQVPGVCHRIFVANGRLVYAMKRTPKSVTGDGEKTIQQLVDDANEIARCKNLKKPPWEHIKPFLLDDLALSCLGNLGLKPDAVLAMGETAPLRPFALDDWGSSAVEVTAITHPDNVMLAIEATKAMGICVAGIDLMTVDISRPWHETGAIIIEVNFTPFLGGNLKNDKTHAYLEAIVRGDGRVPIHAIAGNGDLWQRARAVRQDLAEKGVVAHICGSDKAESPDGLALHLACNGLFLRCRALLRRIDLEALIMVVETPEFLNQGLPTDRLDMLHVVNKAHTESVQNLVKFLSGYQIESNNLERT